MCAQVVPGSNTRQVASGDEMRTGCIELWAGELEGVLQRALLLLAGYQPRAGGALEAVGLVEKTVKAAGSIELAK